MSCVLWEEIHRTYTYDGKGWLLGKTDEEGNETHYHYDSRQVTTAEKGQEGYTYDQAGNLRSTEDALGGVLTYGYNSNSQVAFRTNQQGHTEYFFYDKEGRQVRHVDPRGITTETKVNVYGKPVLQACTDRRGNRVVMGTWAYDDFGHLKEARAGGIAYRYTYRPDGKLLEKSRNGTRVLSCSYYPEGTLKSLTDCRGKPLLYTYDGEGRLESLQTETGKVLARYTYTGAGRMATIESENGMVTRYRYDGEGNIAGLSIRKGEEGLLYDASFTYDLRGNRLTRTGWRLGGDGREETVSAAYAYDAMNRLIREERAGGGERYTYDKNGNRLSRTLFHYALTKEAGNREAAIDLEEHYCYNKGNQLLERKSKEGTIRYTYDGNGNLTREVAQKAGIPGGGKEEAGQTRRYHYDGLNRQVKVGLPDGRSQKIRYDGEGLRAGLTTSEGESYTFLYHEGELICEEKGGQFSRRYIRGTHLAALETEGHQYHSCHLDEQGSTIYLTDRGAEVNNRYTYDAFGNLLEKKEDIFNRILYTGQQYDRETGQYYLRARYYNPVIGRFTQEDTFRGDGLNLYAYCANNPVRYFDPSGHAAETNGCPNGSGEAEVTQQEAAKVDSKSGTASSGLPDWLKARFEAGNNFNKENRPRYPYNEVKVYGDGKNYVVDSYIPGSEIVSRKFTQLASVQESTGIGYLNELQKKYPSGAIITDSPFNPKVLRGKTMTGNLILEIPEQKGSIPQSVIDYANNKGIIIRDVNGKEYN